MKNHWCVAALRRSVLPARSRGAGQGAHLTQVGTHRAVRTLALISTIIGTIATAIASAPSDLSAQSVGAIRFIVISDVHYGITRQTFRGAYDVPAATVNAAMKAAMNALPRSLVPQDGGLGAGAAVGAIDFVAVTGDIANRAENGVQSAATSWQQFTHDFLVGLTLTTADRRRTPVWAVPGNHDASNAIGHTRPLVPETDATSMAQLYNRMVKPPVKRTTTTYNYTTDKVHFSRDVRGVHFAFLNIWPDSAERGWLDGDLRRTKRLHFVLWTALLFAFFGTALRVAQNAKGSEPPPPPPLPKITDNKRKPSLVVRGHGLPCDRVVNEVDGWMVCEVGEWLIKYRPVGDRWMEEHSRQRR